MAVIFHTTFPSAFFNQNIRISIKISLKFVPKCPVKYIASLVQIMAWRRPGDKPLSEPMMVSLLTHISVTRLQWVNCLVISLSYLKLLLTPLNRDNYDVIKWKHFSRNRPFVQGIHRSPHKGQWRGILMFSLICVSKGWWFETLSRPLWRHCNGNSRYVPHMLNQHYGNTEMCTCQKKSLGSLLLTWIISSPKMDK